MKTMKLRCTNTNEDLQFRKKNAEIFQREIEERDREGMETEAGEGMSYKEWLTYKGQMRPYLTVAGAKLFMRGDMIWLRTFNLLAVVDFLPLLKVTSGMILPT